MPASSSAYTTDDTQEDEHDWEIDCIVRAKAVRKSRGKVYYDYRVRWLGFSPADDTWEPPEHFNDPTIIERFWRGVNTRGRDHEDVDDVVTDEEFTPGPVNIGPPKGRRRRRKSGEINVDAIEGEDEALETDDGPHRTTKYSPRNRRRRIDHESSSQETEEEARRRNKPSPRKRRMSTPSTTSSGPRTRSQSRQRRSASSEEDQKRGRLTRIRRKSPDRAEDDPPPKRRRQDPSSMEGDEGELSPLPAFKRRRTSASNEYEEKDDASSSSELPSKLFTPIGGKDMTFVGLKVGPPRRKKKLKKKAQPISVHVKPVVPPAAERDSSTPPVSEYFVSEHTVPEPAPSRKYASVATQTGDYTCDNCEAAQKLPFNETRNKGFQPTGLVSTPLPEPSPDIVDRLVTARRSTSSSKTTEWQPSRSPSKSRVLNQVFGVSSVVVKTQPDGTPFRRFQVESSPVQARTHDRSHVDEGSSLKDSTSQPAPHSPPMTPPAIVSPLGPSQPSWIKRGALSQIQDYSDTPDHEPSSEPDEDPIENDSPVRPPVNTASSASSSTPAAAALPQIKKPFAVKLQGRSGEMRLSKGEKMSLTFHRRPSPDSTPR